MLPVELENLIYQKYFSAYVLPEFFKKYEYKKLKYNFMNNILPLAVNYSIYEKASRIINSMIEINSINSTECVEILDSLYYNLIQTHKLGIIDLFLI